MYPGSVFIDLGISVGLEDPPVPLSMIALPLMLEGADLSDGQLYALSMTFGKSILVLGCLLL